jgi:excisionase family DNA binding protein
MKTDTENSLRAYTTDEAADLLGTSRFTVHRLIQTGKINVIAGFANQRINHAELSRFVNRTEAYRPRRARNGKVVAE